MNRFHLVFGILTFIVFLLTGQYMDIYHNHLRGMEDGMRLLYRTRHIFILLLSFTHIMAGLYLSLRQEKWRKYTQISGSVIIVISTILAVIAFFYEPRTRDMTTPVTHWGMHLMLVGVLLHLIGGFKKTG